MSASADHPSASLSDVQGRTDTRNIPIDKVGVRQITYPISLPTRDGGEQHTVATISMFVSLPHHQKGTHMSRFLEVLHDHTQEISPRQIRHICRDIREKLAAEDAHLECSFTYFISKPAPVTGLPGKMGFPVRFEASSDGKDDFIMSVRVPAASLCPCSKEISAYGAHNQRCEIEARIRFKGMLWIEELVEMCESAASSPVFPVLKRPDEKFVTELAYDNPKFVEDIVRDLAVRLDQDERIFWYAITSENFESIHSHNAYAYVEKDKRNAST
jgi:GTP cyclohydrolase I